jgi:hypothetical protein
MNDKNINIIDNFKNDIKNTNLIAIEDEFER